MLRSRLAALCLVLCFALVAGACASAPPIVAPRAALAFGAGWHADVLEIADAPDNDARRRVIEARLRALGLAYVRLPFAAPEREGVNLIAMLPMTPLSASELPLIVIGAHYDRVALGRGAVDNASGVATVLALAEALARTGPLEHHRVIFALWDLEESGLLGAKAYAAEHGAKVAFYLNFDVFGYGDTLWGMEAEAGTPFGDALRAAAHDAGVPLVLGPQYPTSDHLAFIGAGRPAASLSLVDGWEIPHILDGFAGRPMRVVPRVLQVIHTARDVPDEIAPAAVLKVLPVLLDGLRRWDAAKTTALIY